MLRSKETNGQIDELHGSKSLGLSHWMREKEKERERKKQGERLMKGRWREKKTITQRPVRAFLFFHV